MGVGGGGLYLRDDGLTGCQGDGEEYTPVCNPQEVGTSAQT